MPNNLVSPANPLAGGNFYYVGNIDQNTGHNVAGVDSQDSTHGNTPPGGSALGQQLRCAGTDGCHGHNGIQSGDSAVSNQLLAIKGGHHGDDTAPLTGSITNVAKNFRFLLNIAGKEDDDWEQETTTDHNEYRGDNSFGIANTVSYFCGECHGNSGSGGYHNSTGVGSASPWLRHPTDIYLPQSGEYNSYNPTSTYNGTAPVAYTNPESPTRASATVMCLSCHRAHASPYYRAVRWNYKNTASLTTAISGCIVCHTSKN